MSVKQVFGAGGPLFTHKTTLFHTVAHFKGSPICGQVISGNKNVIFSNEVNDLARFIEETH
jgi:hypothetical protein